MSRTDIKTMLARLEVLEITLEEVRRLVQEISNKMKDKR